MFKIWEVHFVLTLFLQQGSSFNNSWKLDDLSVSLALLGINFEMKLTICSPIFSFKYGSKSEVEFFLLKGS
jgi:hypothetical protein